MLEIGSPLDLKVDILPEQPVDIPAIRTVNEQAFGQRDEADIVDRLRSSCDELLSLVAHGNGQVVGHILFSPVTIAHYKGMLKGAGLGPLSVLPEYQRRGIGSQLVMNGLEILKLRSIPFVIVLGHPEYYPRFGFQRTSLYGIHSQWQGIPDEAFMILVLNENDMVGVSGVARYRDEFDASVSTR